MAPRRVIDGSKWNSRQAPPGVFTCILDVDQLRDHAEAAIWRTNDAMYTDPVAYEHLRRSHQFDFPWGVYVYFRSTQDPVRQADLCYAIVRWAVGDILPPCGVWADFEEEQPIMARAAYVRAMDVFLKRLDENFGMVAGIYTRASWLDQWVTAAEQQRWLHRPLWLAAPKAARPAIPLGWRDAAVPYLLHQYSWEGNLPGIGAPVDLNTYHPERGLMDLAPRLDIGTMVVYNTLFIQDLPVELADQVREHLAALAEDLQENQRCRPYGLVVVVPEVAETTSLSLLTNQAVINLFSTAFGKANYWAVLVRAGLDRQLVDNRQALFVGPPVEELPLTEVERQKLLNALRLG